MQLRQAIKQGLSEALKEDPSVFIMGEDIGEYGGAYAVTEGLLAEFGPKRIKDTPISEATFLGAGIGAAVGGLKPIVELMSMSFALVAFDQIVNMAANLRYMSGGQINVPMVIRAPTGAGVQLAATHSQSFETWLADVPGIKTVCPSNAYDALGLIRSAVKDPNPVIFAEPALLYGSKADVPDSFYEIPIGSGNLTRTGTDVTLVSYGAGMPILHDVSNALLERNKSADVIDLRSLSPVDIELIIKSIEKTNRVLLLDTARKKGGIMSELAADIQQEANEWLDGPVIRIGAENVPWPYSSVLEQRSYPQVETVINALTNEYGL